MIFNYKFNSYNYTNEIHSKIYLKLKYWRKNFKMIKYDDLKKHNKIILNKEITSLEIAVLNYSLMSDKITVRCFSKDLFNCIPTNEIVSVSDKKIVKIFNISSKILTNQLPNIFI